MTTDVEHDNMKPTKTEDGVKCPAHTLTKH